MADYFDEMHCTPLADGEAPDGSLHLARLLRDYAMFEELGETSRLPPPTSEAVIEKLPQIQMEPGSKCTICLKDFASEEKARQLPCRHAFHDECILPWLKKTSTCPMCRHDLPTDDETYEEYKKEKKREKTREEDIDALHNSMFS
ncbi:Zinc finger, C3HHypothetical protein type (RING finger) [Nesidiocoris tenuis]|uniref:RING-type domain-containing protein n=1 Tax=Nesidiocoris tenuis TaxID=355587 RepID=A0ABN7AIY1_9HEMI|nr:Zinc finger, C3HHypothetical protein type (RING finger) [Nesidiocoris tenuis]